MEARSRRFRGEVASVTAPPAASRGQGRPASRCFPYIRGSESPLGVRNILPSHGGVFPVGPAAPFHVHLGSCQESFRCSPKGQTCSLGSAAGQTPPSHLLLRNTARKCQAAWRRGDVSAMPGHLHACHEEMVKVAGNAHVGREPQGVPALGSWARAAARPLRQAGARPAARRSALEPRQAPGGSWVLSQPCHTSGVPFPKAPPAPGLCSALPGRPPLSSPSASQTRRSSKAELVAFIPHPGALPGAWHRVGVQSIFVQ